MFLVVGGLFPKDKRNSYSFSSEFGQILGSVALVVLWREKGECFQEPQELKLCSFIKVFILGIWNSTCLIFNPNAIL